MNRRGIWAAMGLWAMLIAGVSGQSPRTGPTLPTCRVGDVFQKTGADAGLYQCTATNTWTRVGRGPVVGDTLAGLADVTLISPTDADVLTYDAASSTWKNLPASGGSGGTSWDGTILSFADTNRDVFAGANNTVTLARALTSPAVLFGMNNVLTTADTETSRGYWTVLGVGNTIDTPGEGVKDGTEIQLLGANNTLSGSLGNWVTILGAENYVTSVGDVTEMTVVGANQSVGSLEDANQSTLIGADNTITGGPGGSAVATFLIGQGNQFTTTDATSITDSTFVLGWANHVTVPASANWAYTVSVGVSNAIGFGQTMTFGNHLTPTASDQTWFGDTVNPIFFRAGDISACPMGQTAPVTLSVDDAGTISLTKGSCS